MPNRATAVLVLGILTVVVAACTGSGASPGSGGSDRPSDTSHASPAVTVDPDVIDHPTGATDVVLRIAETGGFVMMDWAMVRVPMFTLYGDGRVLVAGPAQAAKGAPGTLDALPRLFETRLSEDEVQAILRSALTDGRLGVAKEQYAPAMMDLPSTVFDVRAGGVTKRVSVGGLSAEPQPGPDAPVIAALARLAERLRSIRAETPYVPPAWLALIAEAEPDPGQPGLAPWPWPDTPPAAFTQPGPDDPAPFPRAVLSQAEAEASGADLAAGGAIGLRYAGPDGKSYVVVLRPALPEEAAAG